MTKPIAVVALMVAAATASGCASLSRAVGATRSSPDEFRVVTQAPLTLPPDYNLRPPRPGDPRPSELQPSEEARAALFGETTGAAASQGERQLVAGAGATTADATIRDTIDFESQGVVRRNEGFVDRLISFGGSSAPVAAPLNAEEEAARLQDEEATRRVTGGGQIVIERDRGGFKLPGT
ncbi:DUF3035 domain-containing protein [Vitreimonas flagellata]|uniref:DUF3035 domain-containing protein n=1 Tax=Vitreimonas flagellata TaxID=2560861 RepID=UPI001074F775|nr:DUF3035 domain-containing protein [Vitreimonas flagellata]